MEFLLVGLFCVALFFGGFYLGWLFAGGRVLTTLPKAIGGRRGFKGE